MPSPEAAFSEAGVAAQVFAPARGRMFGRLQLLTAEDAALAPKRDYFLHGLIAPHEMSVWWGAPKCGKSFLLLRLAYGLAVGTGMWGLEARACRVLYVAAEGEGGLAARLLALRATFGPAPGFAYSAQRVEVGPPSFDLPALRDAIKAHRADVVVIDTLARTFGAGNEDTAQDTGAFVRKLDELRAPDPANGYPGCHVAVVHHGPKDEHAKTPRGSSALVGAADLVVKIAKGAGGAPHTATVDAAKDDADGMSFSFALVPAELREAGGVSRLTCIAEEAEAAAARTPTSKLTEDLLGWLRDIQGIFINGSPELRSPLPDMKPTLTLTREQVRKGLRVRGRFASEAHAAFTDAERRKLADKLNALKDKGKIGMTDTYIWLT
jgi:hypothetical protein